MKQILSIWCIILSVFLQAQDCNRMVSGKVIDFHSGEPISHAQLNILGKNIKTHTNSEGEFTLKNLCLENYSIEVSHVDCDIEYYDLKPNEDKEVTIYLEHHIIDLEKIEIKGVQHTTLYSVGEDHLHDEEIQRNSSQSMGTLLKNVTGVDGLSTGSNIVKPIIHGMHSSRVLMLNNGIKQEDMEWGVEHAPTVDVNNFSDIKIIKGGAALRYGGDAIGGVVLAEYPKLPQQDTLKASILLAGKTNGQGGNGVINIQKGFTPRLAMQIQGSYKKLGDLETPHYLLTNTASEHKSIMSQLKWGDYKRNLYVSYSYYEQDLGILKATHIGSLKDLYTAIHSNYPTPIEDFDYTIDKPYQNIVHHLAKIKGENRWQSFGKLEATYAFQSNIRKEFDVRLGEKKNIPAMDTQLNTHHGELVLTLDKWAHLEVIGGVSGMLQNNYTNPNTGVKRLIPDYDRYDVGVFATSQYQWNNQWKLDAGIRYDYHQLDTKKFYDKDFWNVMNYHQDFNSHIIGDFGNEWLTQFNLKFHTVSLGIGTYFSPLANTKFRLNYALNNRAPNPSELFSEGLHHSAVSIELGDVRIKPETSHKFSVGFQQKINLLNGLNIDLLGYYNHINDYIFQIPTGARYTIRGAFPVYSFKQTNATLYGIDIDTQLQITNQLVLTQQLSYIHGTDHMNNQPLILMPPLDWKQSLKYKNTSKWNPFIGISTIYTAKQNRYPNYNFPIRFIENGQEVTKDLDLSTPPKAYFLVGLNAGIDIPNKMAKTQLNLNINNLFNKTYRNYLNRFRYYADELGRQIELQLIINF